MARYAGQLFDGENAQRRNLIPLADGLFCNSERLRQPGKPADVLDCSR